MKRFVFRLQVLLDQAEKREQEEQKRLAALLETRERLLRAIATVQAARDALLDEITRLQQATLDLWLLQTCHARRETLGSDLVSLNDDLAAQEQRVRDQQRVLAEATHRRQGLENLREQHYEAYRREADLTELKEMEEVVLPRLAREQARAHAQAR